MSANDAVKSRLNEHAKQYIAIVEAVLPAGWHLKDGSLQQENGHIEFIVVEADGTEIEYGYNYSPERFETVNKAVATMVMGPRLFCWDTK